jgi:photosystem II stability/assembly factor-like uncharacterized protein
MIKSQAKTSFLRLSVLKNIFITIIIVSSNLLAQGWQWQNPLPQGNPISSLMYFNKDVVWASVSGGGSQLKSTNGGDTWKTIVLPEVFYGRDVFFLDDNIGWACGEHYLFKTTDGGKNWDTQKYDSSITFYKVAFTNERLGWLTGGGSRIYNTTDGGKNWNLQANFNGYINSFSLVDSLHLWAVNTDGPVGAVGGAIFYTKDGGKNWLADSTVDWGYDIQFVDSLNGWISGKDKITHTTDGGKTWNTQFNMSGNWINISIPDKKHGFAITSSNIVVTTNGGDTWEIKNNLDPYDLNTISFYDSLNGLAAGWGGVIVKTTDGGTNWKLITKSLTNSQLRNIFFIDNSTGWICGYNGTILKTTNSGDNWTKLITNNSAGLGSIYFIDQQNGFAVGSGGIIMKTNDGGTSWTSSNNGTISWNDIDFSNYPTGWVVGGDSFTECRLIKTTDGGGTWNEDTSISLTTGNSEIHFTSKETGWLLIGDLGLAVQQLYKTTDGGNTWNLIKWNYSDTAYSSWQFISDNVGWISTFPYPSGIFHTINGGESWEKYNTPESFISISFIDSLTGWGASLREIYITKDGGKTWTHQQVSGDQLARVNFINNKLGFAIGYGGEIHRTTSGGITSVFEEKEIKGPDNFILYQNYPNPFNPTTIIKYTIAPPNLLKGEAVVQLKIYDILGREVATLVNEKQHPGTYTVNFNGNNLSSGIYFYQLRVGSYSLTKKMVYLK